MATVIVFIIIIMSSLSSFCHCCSVLHTWPVCIHIMTEAHCVYVSQTTNCLCISVLQCMFVIWLGAFTSLSLAMFSGYSSQLMSAGSATGMLASIATRSLPWSLDGGDDVDVGWRLFMTLFCVSAVASMSAYVSPPLCFSCCLLQCVVHRVDHKNQTVLEVGSSCIWWCRKVIHMSNCSVLCLD